MAMQASQMNNDMKIFLEKGYLTTIGERGVNISGGQKARLVLDKSNNIDSDNYLLK